MGEGGKDALDAGGEVGWVGRMQKWNIFKVVRWRVVAGIGIILGVAGTAGAELVRDTPPRVRSLMELGHEWRLYQGPGEPEGAWTSPAYDDARWAVAPGVVGLLTDPEALERYGELELRTKLPEGRETVYLRAGFEFDGEVEADARLVLDHLIKDGAVLYLNRVEAGRTSAMPRTGEVGHESRAVIGPRPRLKTGFFVDPGLLRKGWNVLALSLHGYDDEENAPDRIAAVRLTLTEGWERRPLTTEPVHFRVMWAECPQHEAMVSWSTSAESRENVVFYDTEPRRGRVEGYEWKAGSSRSGSYVLSREDVEHGTRPGQYHHVHLKDLLPDTTYYLVMSSDGEVSREFHFRTAPAEDRPFKILFGGDSRIGGYEPYFHHDRRAINRRMVALLEEHPEIIAFYHGGDIAQLAQWRYLSPWLTDHELTITQDGRILPIIAARGNHDNDIGFEEVFWWPGQEQRYTFVTDLSPAVSIITLNSEISHGGSQRRFLQTALETLRPERRWLLTGYHKPAYPSVRGFETGADRRRFWVPLFEANRIDLSLESHDHALKRTVPILEGARHPDGVVYIGDGGLGVPQRVSDPTRWYLQDEGMTMSTHHAHVLEFNEDTLVGTAYTIGGEVVDRFVLARRDPAAGYARIALPEPAAVAVDE